MTTRRLAAFRAKANAQPLRPIGQFIAHALSARETPFHAAALANAPDQARFNSAGRLINVTAVKAKPGFKPQRIPRTKPRRHHARQRQQAARKGLRLIGRDRDFNAIFPGIAAAGDDGLHPTNIKAANPHEGKRGKARRQCYQGGHRPRPLQRQKRAIFMPMQRHTLRQMRGDMAEIMFLAAGIHHQENPVAQIGEHEIIQNAATWRCQQPIALPPGLKPCNVGGR